MLSTTHYGIGVPMRKVSTILREQSAIQKDAMRRNQAEVGEEYQKLRASVKDAKRVFTDDTGEHINGESAYMMGFDELIPSTSYPCLIMTNLFIGCRHQAL